MSHGICEPCGEKLLPKQRVTSRGPAEIADEIARVRSSIELLRGEDALRVAGGNLVRLNTRLGELDGELVRELSSMEAAFSPPK